MTETNSNNLIVGMGDIKTGKAPSKITTSLGSCIAVCLYSANDKIGGMLHFMMSSSDNAKKDSPGFREEKYADTGITKLISILKDSHKVELDKVQAKIFGGARVLQQFSTNIGEENTVKAKKILKDLNIKITAEETGGEKGYRINFDLNTGKVLCKVLGKDETEY